MSRFRQDLGVIKAIVTDAYIQVDLREIGERDYTNWSCSRKERVSHTVLDRRVWKIALLLYAARSNMGSFC
jgi:hypothetical protein